MSSATRIWEAQWHASGRGYVTGIAAGREPTRSGTSGRTQTDMDDTTQDYRPLQTASPGGHPGSLTRMSRNVLASIPLALALLFTFIMAITLFSTSVTMSPDAWLGLLVYAQFGIIASVGLFIWLPAR